MKKTIFAISILTALFSTNAMSNYTAKIFIDKNAFKLQEKNEITGTAQLTPSTINRGESSTISWNYEYANEVSIEGVGTYGKSGSVNVSSLSSKNYKVIATYGGVSKVENLFLNVLQPNSNVSFTTDKSRIGIGQFATLTWNVSNANYINIDNSVNSGQNVEGNYNGSYNVYPETDTTYTLSGVDFNNDPLVSSVFIEVVNNSTIQSFNTSSLNVTKGRDVNFNWEVKDSEILELIPFGSVSANPTGTQVVNFPNVGSFDYTLKSTSLSGSVVYSSPININVYDNAVITSFNVNGSKNTIDVSPNEELTFSWTADNQIAYTFNGLAVNGNYKTIFANENIGKTNYVLSAFNAAGDASDLETISVNVVEFPVINSFNAPSNVIVGSQFTLSWSGTNVVNYKIKSNDVNSGISTSDIDLGTNLSRNITPNAGGTFTYTITATNSSGATISRDIIVIVEANPTIETFIGPSNVFADSAFTMSWTGTNVVNYKIKANSAASGISTSDVDLGTVLNRNIIPTAAGNYTYTITATNAAGVKTTSTKTVVVESIPTFTNFTVNGKTSVTVAPNATLTYASSGFTTGSSFAARNNLNDAAETHPAKAPTAAGTYTYYGVATRTLNGITKYSPLKSIVVSVVIADNPIIENIASNYYPNINEGEAASITWSGKNIDYYTISSNNKESGVPTTELNLGKVTYKSVSPTAIGTYTYTVTAYNIVGESIQKNITINVVSISWDAFANRKNLKKSSDIYNAKPNWESLNWHTKSLSTLPSQPYPLATAGTLYFQANSITNVVGLSSLRNVNLLYLYNNKIKSIEPLSNITNVNSLSLHMNEITNVDALIGLTTIKTLSLEKNPLNNINGLRNLEITLFLSIDKSYSGPKLSASSRFCTLNDESKFYLNRPEFAKKSDLCESP